MQVRGHVSGHVTGTDGKVNYPLIDISNEGALICLWGPQLLSPIHRLLRKEMTVNSEYHFALLVSAYFANLQSPFGQKWYIWFSAVSLVESFYFFFT